MPQAHFSVLVTTNVVTISAWSLSGTKPSARAIWPSTASISRSRRCCSTDVPSERAMKKNKGTVRRTAKQIKAMRRRGEDRTDYARLDAMTAREIDASAKGEGSFDWARVQVGLPSPKRRSRCVSTAMLSHWFKRQGRGSPSSNERRSPPFCRDAEGPAAISISSAPAYGRSETAGRGRRARRSKPLGVDPVACCPGMAGNHPVGCSGDAPALRRGPSRPSFREHGESISGLVGVESVGNTAPRASA